MTDNKSVEKVEKPSKTYSYLLFLTVLTPMYLNKISNSLIAKGYLVEPASADKISVFTTPNLLSSLIAMRLYSVKSDIGAVYDDVLMAINEVEALFYSVLIVDGLTAARFNIGNIEVVSKVVEESVKDLN
jgi:hypothetical protein